MPVVVQPTMQELTDAIRSLANGKAVGPDVVSVEMFKITLNGDPALRRRLLDIVVRIWRRGEVPQQWKDAIIMGLHKKKDRTECGLKGHLAGSARRQDTGQRRHGRFGMKKKGGGGAEGSNCRRVSPRDAALGYALR